MKSSSMALWRFQYYQYYGGWNCSGGIPALLRPPEISRWCGSVEICGCAQPTQGVECPTRHGLWPQECWDNRRWSYGFGFPACFDRYERPIKKSSFVNPRGCELRPLSDPAAMVDLCAAFLGAKKNTWRDCLWFQSCWHQWEDDWFLQSPFDHWIIGSSRTF